MHIACMQTSPISFVARGTKEIGDVCTQAKMHTIQKPKGQRLYQFP